MKKILVTRKLLKDCEDKATKTFEAKLNSNDELYSQSKLIELSQGCDAVLTSLTDKMDEETINKLPKTVKVISDLTKDVTEYLNESLKLDFKSKDKKYKIAYHSACSMQHGQKVHSQPIELLSKTKNEIMEIPEGHICCGSAGTYNILQTKIAKELLKKKVNNIESLKPDFISTGNIGCITQISNGTQTPILHTIEILDWYTGGPKPKILQKN